MHRDAVEAGKQTALETVPPKRRRFSTMDFRDALGVSRKFAVPLLDYLDKIRFTVRSGNQPHAGSRGEETFELRSSRREEALTSFSNYNEPPYVGCYKKLK